jgi:hypothetical protein
VSHQVIPHAAKVACVIVHDLSGWSLKNIEVMGRGKTSVTIGSGDMNHGMYFYSLSGRGRSPDKIFLAGGTLVRKILGHGDITMITR